MRLRASLQRCKRLTDGFAQAQLDAFAGTALSLGGALGMPSDIQTVFAEAEIRCGNTRCQMMHCMYSLLACVCTEDALCVHRRCSVQAQLFKRLDPVRATLVPQVSHRSRSLSCLTIA